MSDILSLQTPYVDGDTVTSTNLNDLVKKATFTSAVVDGATTQLSSGAIIVRDGGITEQKLSTAAQAKLLQGPELEQPDALIGGDKTGNTRGSDSLDIQSSRVNLDEVASGDEAVAVGLECKAGGGNSVVYGFSGTADGDDCVSIGVRNVVDADSDKSVAVGVDNTYNSDNSNPNLYSSIFGYNNTVTDGKNCVAIGLNNNTSSQDCIAIGATNTVSQFGGIAIGDTNSSGSGGYGVAIGIGNSVDGSIAFGKNNSSSDEGVSVGKDCTSTSSAVAIGNNCDASGPTGVAVGKDVVCDQVNSFAAGNGISVSSGSDISTFAIGISSTCAVRGHPNGQIAFTLDNSATAPTDGGAISGAANLTLPRSMFSIQRNGDAFTLYFNDGGTIKSLSLGSVS